MDSLRAVDVGWRKGDYTSQPFADQIILSEQTLSALVEEAVIIVNLDRGKEIRWKNCHKAEIGIFRATDLDVLTPQEKASALRIGSNYYFFAMEGDYLSREFYRVSNKDFLIDLIHTGLQYTDWTIPGFGMEGA